MKYPRTYHLPFSPGATKDDKKLHGDWFNNYKGKEIVITEKLDGENVHMDQKDCYARSDGAPTRSPWSRNIWDNDGLYWKIKDLIGPNETIYGENLYGEHSIHYERLTSYFHLFAVSGGFAWESWDDVQMMAQMMDIPTVPELWKGKVNSENELRNLVEEFVKQPSVYGSTREGVVIRLRGSFGLDDFSNCVCKWVRPNHVQTDEHWTKNWKKAKLTNGIITLPKSIIYCKTKYDLDIHQITDDDKLNGWWMYTYTNKYWKMPIEIKDSVNHEGYFLVSMAPTKEAAYEDFFEKVSGIPLNDSNIMLYNLDY